MIHVPELGPYFSLGIQSNLMSRLWALPHTWVLSGPAWDTLAA